VADTVRRTTPLSEPVFDFFAGSFGLLLAALPLAEGLVATVPVNSHAAGFLAMEVRVGAKEEVDAGGARKEHHRTTPEGTHDRLRIGIS
jgi:hypothetical protein